MPKARKVFRVVLPVVFEVEASNAEEAEEKAVEAAMDTFAVGVDAVDTHNAQEVDDITEGFNERARRLAEIRKRLDK